MQSLFRSHSVSLSGSQVVHWSHSLMHLPWFLIFWHTYINDLFRLFQHLTFHILGRVKSCNRLWKHVIGLYMLSVLLLDQPMPNMKMEEGERKANLEKTSWIQLEMLGMIEISIELNKFQALTDWRSECQMQSDNVCKGWFLIGSSSQDVDEVTKIPTEMWAKRFHVLNSVKPLGRQLQETWENTASVEYRRFWRKAEAGWRLESRWRTRSLSLMDGIVCTFLCHEDHRTASRDIYSQDSLLNWGKSLLKKGNSDWLCRVGICTNSNRQKNLHNCSNSNSFLQKIIEDQINHIKILQLDVWKPVWYSYMRVCIIHAIYYKNIADLAVGRVQTHFGGQNEDLRKDLCWISCDWF